jgi:hypothetical protein
MELRYKPHDIPFRVIPKILEKAKVYPIGTGALEAIAIPDRFLHLQLRKRFGQTAAFHQR